MLERLPIPPAQIKTANTSEKSYILGIKKKKLLKCYIYEFCK